MFQIVCLDIAISTVGHIAHNPNSIPSQGLTTQREALKFGTKFRYQCFVYGVCRVSMHNLSTPHELKRCF